MRTSRSHVVLMTLGGPVYCGLLLPLAAALDATRLCPDYGRNGEKNGASRNLRIEDWATPATLRRSHSSRIAFAGRV